MCNLMVKYISSFIVLALGSVWRCETSYCDLNLTFDLTVVALIFKILSGLYLGNFKCRKLITVTSIGWVDNFSLYTFYLS